MQVDSGSSFQAVFQVGAVLCKCSCPGPEPQNRLLRFFEDRVTQLTRCHNSCLQTCPALSRRLTWLAGLGLQTGQLSFTVSVGTPISHLPVIPFQRLCLCEHWEISILLLNLDELKSTCKSC